MSRIASKPIVLESGVDAQINAQLLSVKGSKGALSLDVHPDVSFSLKDNELVASPKEQTQAAIAMTGTMRALANNMVIGVSQGFEKKLTLVGVGYRAQAQGKKVTLNLGFSFPVEHTLPEGITVETPSQTEIIVKGVDKQLVGQVAADIRAYRPPEPYKGKGVRYADERVVIKETKKK